MILLGRKQAPVCLDLEISHTTSIELKENDSKEKKEKMRTMHIIRGND